MTVTDPQRLERAVRAQLPNGGRQSPQTTRRFLHEQVVITPQGEVPAAAGKLWDPSRPRSQLRWLHGFVFVGDWVRSWDVLTESEKTDLTNGARALLKEWDERFHAWPKGDPMAYHDETTALRLRSLAALHQSPMGEQLMSPLSGLMDTTAKILAREDFYAGLNNHGMFQDGALLTYGGLVLLSGESPRPESETAWRRAAHYAAASFCSDGVHNEHSPSYHLLVSQKLAQFAELAAAMGLEPSPTVKRVLATAASFATHATTPQSRFVPLGDTARGPISPKAVSAYDSEEFAWAVTHADGRVPAARAAVFPESGYGAFRTSWEGRDAAYVMVANAYNGGYHKHSDELNVYLEADGIAILDDSGPYGYDYKDPLVSYAYSSHGHNTLLVDGRGLPRHDGSMDKTWLTDEGSTSNELHVTATTTRFDGVRATRTVAAQGDSADSFRLLITDNVSSDESHGYTFLWHFGPELTPVLRGTHVELFRSESKVAELAITGNCALHLAVVAGDTESGDPRAIHFPSMGKALPAHVLEVQAFTQSAQITTEVRLGEFQLRDRGVRPGSSWQTSSGSVPLRYLLEPGEAPTALTVVFSSIREFGDFTYDYYTALRGTDTAKLFILDDFGVQGSYYHSNAREPGIFQSVQALIAQVTEHLGLSRSAVTTMGSSKGGSAAMIHGYAAGVGRVLAGAPQTKIGHFTRGHHPEVLRFLAGGAGPGDEAWANQILPRQLRNASPETRVSILVGANDHHLKGHVLPFSRLAASVGKPVSVTTIPNVTHADIGAAFRDFARSALTSKAQQPYVARVDHDTGTLIVGLGDLLRGRTAACYLYRDGVVVDKTKYSDQPVRTWSIDAGHQYHVRIFVRQGSDQLPTFNTAKVMIPPEVGTPTA